MGRMRRTTARFGGWLVLAVVMLAAVSVTAYALTRGDGKAPPKRPLAVALHDALIAKPVAGVSAHFTVTQHLIPGTSKLLATSPLLGASGSVWASGHRVKVVVTSALGTAEVAFDGKTVTLYEPKQKAAYRLTLPRHHPSSQDAAEKAHAAPSVSDITHVIKELGRTMSVSGAIPGVIADQPAYTVKIGAKHDSGLVGPLAIAWDAVHGTPLRIALYSKGSGTPAIAFTVTHITYGTLPARDMMLTLPHGTKVTPLELPGSAEAHRVLHRLQKHVKATIDHGAPTALQLPATLAGMPRGQVHATGPGTVAVYGHGLGSIVVIARTASPDATQGAAAMGALPTTVMVNGVHGHELVTTLGTIVSFTHAGVSYTVLASQPAATVLSAARALP
jgi:hypothetical protein